MNPTRTVIDRAHRRAASPSCAMPSASCTPPARPGDRPRRRPALGAAGRIGSATRSPSAATSRRDAALSAAGRRCASACSSRRSRSPAAPRRSAPTPHRDRPGRRGERLRQPVGDGPPLPAAGGHGLGRPERADARGLHDPRLPCPRDRADRARAARRGRHDPSSRAAGQGRDDARRARRRPDVLRARGRLVRAGGARARGPVAGAARTVRAPEETLRIAHRCGRRRGAPIEGRHYRLDEPITAPQPLSRPRPRLMVGGGGRADAAPRRPIRRRLQHPRARPGREPPLLERLRGDCEADRPGRSRRSRRRPWSRPTCGPDGSPRRRRAPRSAAQADEGIEHVDREHARASARPPAIRRRCGREIVPARCRRRLPHVDPARLLMRRAALLVLARAVALGARRARRLRAGGRRDDHATAAQDRSATFDEDLVVEIRATSRSGSRPATGSATGRVDPPEPTDPRASPPARPRNRAST